ncbi:hypothetical protein D3C84_918120 [compost metagenome]
MWGLILVVDGEREVFHIQRNAVAEDHHHEQGAEQGEGQANFVTQQLFAFAGSHGEQASDAETLGHQQWRCRGGCIQLLCSGRRFARALGLFKAGDKRVFQGGAGELLLECGRCVASQYLTGVHQADAVTTQRLVHEVGGEEDSHPLIP